MTRPCTKCGRNRSERYFTSPRGRVCEPCRKATRSRAAHGTRIEATYGITATEYNTLLNYQNGACAMCGGTRKYRLHVDHDHKLEREQGSRASVRGLLCARCNKLLAKAGDDTNLLAAAIKYLKNPPARKVIE